MKTKIILGLCISGLASSVFADGYPGNQIPDSGYTTTTTTTYGSEYPQQKHRHHKKEHTKSSITVNFPPPRETVHETVIVRENRPHHHFREPTWVNMVTGAPLPMDAVVGGGQYNPPATLYVCRAHYRGGMHPGKLYQGRCNIGWGGEEIVKNHYEVLVSRASLAWVPAGYGQIPSGAIQGGYQHDGPLFICQANYHGGTHVGKVVGQTCNFGWGGREVFLPHYNVLAR